MPFDDFNFNGNNNSNSGRVAEPEPREIDNNGNYRDGNNGNNYGGNNGNGRRGLFNRNRNNGGGGGGGSYLKVIAFFVILFLGFVLFKNGVFDGLSKDPNESLTSMLNAVEYNKEVIKKGDGTYGESVYERDALYDESYIYSVPDNIYMIYYYTGDNLLDAEFNRWVENNEDTYKIYRISQFELKNYLEEFAQYTTNQNRPVIVLYDSFESTPVAISGEIESTKLDKLGEGYKGIAESHKRIKE